MVMVVFDFLAYVNVQNTNASLSQAKKIIDDITHIHTHIGKIIVHAKHEVVQGTRRL